MRARASVMRGAESWQFFAFVFTAAMILEIAWISECSNMWARVALDGVAFLVTFGVVMFNGWVRNKLVGVLNIIKKWEAR